MVIHTCCSVSTLGSRGRRIVAHLRLPSTVEWLPGQTALRQVAYNWNNGGLRIELNLKETGKKKSGERALDTRAPWRVEILTRNGLCSGRVRSREACLVWRDCWPGWSSTARVLWSAPACAHRGLRTGLWLFWMWKSLLSWRRMALLEPVGKSPHGAGSTLGNLRSRFQRCYPSPALSILPNHCTPKSTDSYLG